MKLFNAIFISVLLYGLIPGRGCKKLKKEYVGLKATVYKKKKIMKIRWYDHVIYEELRRRTGQQSLVEKIRIARWNCCGHALRMPDERIPKQAHSWMPDGRR